jgi:hypothetical protein
MPGLHSLIKKFDGEPVSPSIARRNTSSAGNVAPETVALRLLHPLERAARIHRQLQRAKSLSGAFQ